ncbi:MAG: glycosyltransferase family 2 protein [Acidobacteriia bacterium]|nr:glycosyltransferase family 2 protein [Terriglobia bacterium]
MPISVIVSNFNGFKYLERLISTLEAQQDVTTEIIIVDRHSTDGSLEYLRRFPHIRVTSEPAITGLVAGYAAGAKLARYDHLFFCNEDMWFDPLCLARLQRHIDLSANIVAADPWQWTYDGKSWIHGGVRFYRTKWEPNSPYPWRGVDFTVSLAEGDRVPFPCAGAFLMHRRAYEELGGWDTSFFLDHEDIDLFVRAWQRGWHCVTVPEAKVYHAVSASDSKVLANGSRVLPRRYIANRSNLVVIGLKYYSGASLLVAALGSFVPLISDVLKLRWRKLSLDVRSILATVRRMREVRAFRKRNRQWIQSRPGRQFFLQEDLTRP